MKKISLKVKSITKGPGYYKDKIAVQCSVTGTSIRHYILIDGLKQPFSLNDWSEKIGKFIDGENAIYNNSIISSTLKRCEELIAKGSFSNGKELFTAFQKKQTKSTKPAKQAKRTIPTFIEWLETFINEEKNKPTAKSTNYQLYCTLLNKLNGIGKKQGCRFTAPKCNGKLIGSFLVNEVDTAYFKSFCNWVLSDLEGKGYRNLCTTFLASISKAIDRFPSLNFKVINAKNWRKLKPAKKASETLTAIQKLNAVANGIPVLTIEEIQKLESFNLSTIAANANKRNLELLELYRDFALLIYYLGSRPADVLQLHTVRNYVEERKTIIYVPFKLRNREGKHTIIELQDKATSSATIKKMNAKALEIIAKYANKSKGGYLLPFPINEKDWGEIDGANFSSWESLRNDTLQSVNAALKKMAKALDLSVPNLTLYTFRHSSITHAINAGENWGTVALRSGTSVKMIEKHYYNAAKG